jgi:hypothetical protein
MNKIIDRHDQDIKEEQQAQPDGLFAVGHFVVSYDMADIDNNIDNTGNQKQGIKTNQSDDKDGRWLSIRVIYGFEHKNGKHNNKQQEGDESRDTDQSLFGFRHVLYPP